MLELFSQKQEDDTKALLMAYWHGKDRVVGNKYASSALETNPEFVMETYFITFGVKAMALTETANHITGRAIVFVTSEDKVYQIPERVFSARRPHEEKTKTFEEELNSMRAELEEARLDAPRPLVLKSQALQKYDPVIAQSNRLFLTYDLELVGLSEIQAMPTRLESTTQVFAYGHDLFMVRLTPDRGYDLLDEDFNYIALFAAIIGFTVFDLFASRYLE